MKKKGYYSREAEPAKCGNCGTSYSAHGYWDGCPDGSGRQWKASKPAWWLCPKCGLTRFNHGSRRCNCG